MSDSPSFQEVSHDPALAGRKRPNIGGAIAPHFGDKSVTWAFAQILEKTLVPALRAVFGSEAVVE